jgi:superfamily I DNA/RNA helicase
MTDMTWTPNQIAVFDWVKNGKGNAIIEAVAGSGKTTTLVELLKYATGYVALCAYNKKMGDELKARTAGMKGVYAGTLHSFGFKALLFARKSTGLKVDDNKVYDIINTLLSEDEAKFYGAFIRRLVGLAKDTGIGFFTPIDDRQAWQDIIDHHDLSLENDFGSYDDAISWAIQVLKRSNEIKNVIDFGDMIYHVLVHGVRVLQHDFVLVDEAQDTNATRRALARKLLKAKGRLIAVGDPHQAIFGFTGADNDSLDLIRKDFNAITLPLTVSFRCPKSVVAHARNWVDHIEPCDTAIEGSVSTMEYADLLANAKGMNLSQDDAILCRKNAPLVELAFTLIRQGIPCRMEGRDIGMQLVRLAGKWKVKRLDALTNRLTAFRDREVQKAQAKGNDVKAEQIDDRCGCLFVLIERAEEKGLDVAGLQDMIKDMFADTDPNKPSNILVLSSVHKAKGLEWKNVMILGREQFMPSQWARQEWQQDQETNLIYVAVTRAQETLVEIVNVPE